MKAVSANEARLLVAYRSLAPLMQLLVLAHAEAQADVAGPKQPATVLALKRQTRPQDAS